MNSIAIIGGTGWDEAALKSTFPQCAPETVSTVWGEARVMRHVAVDREIIFLHRHIAPGRTTHLPPHRINYRANLAALHKLGVQRIFASSAVGSLHADWTSGSFALIDQIIDFTSSRKSTFHDEQPVHTDMTTPYDERGQVLLRKAAARHQISFHENATYICTNGPRFETTAEIRLFAQWGADVVGMTGMPEVTLARELQIPYSAIAVITNAAAGISPNPLTHKEVTDAMHKTLPLLKSLLLDAAELS